MSARLPVRKTYKLFVGGAFPRSESGRTLEVEGYNVARASRKDAREAVVAARKAVFNFCACSLRACSKVSRYEAATEGQSIGRPCSAARWR